MCSELHIPPRGGGLLDQPAHEVVLLEKIYEASDKHQKRTEERDANRKKNRERHKPE